MSINQAERQRTSLELRALRNTLPVSDEALAERLGYADSTELNDVLELDHSVAPSEVWRVRDFLSAVADHLDLEGPGFSILQDNKRELAKGWFGGWTVPSPEGLAGR